jgi:hypothetical protein
VTAAAVLVVLVLIPRAAWACATCVASAYGDRTFNWAFLGLLLMPFVVGIVIAGVLAVLYYVSSGRAASGPAQLAAHEESSL